MGTHEICDLDKYRDENPQGFFKLDNHDGYNVIIEVDSKGQLIEIVAKTYIQLSETTWYDDDDDE